MIDKRGEYGISLDQRFDLYCSLPVLPTRVEDPGGEVDPDPDPSHREKTGSVSNRQEKPEPNTT